MAVVLEEQGVDRLVEAVDVLRGWQHDASPMQLHPGDLGWYWVRGPEATATAVRTWRRHGRILAIGLVDGPDLVRLTTAPEARRDEELARQLAADVTTPERGVLPAGTVAVEAPVGTLVLDRLSDQGWTTGDPWTPLSCDLARPVAEPGVRIDVVGPVQAGAWAAVHRSAFGSGARFTDERWRVMASGLPFADARCLLAIDDCGEAVAMVAVWSAGPGRPGLLEPMGVHAEHRGRGYGKAITLAAAAALQELGCSSAMVCTISSRVGAVHTYVSAGFEKLPERTDRVRGA